ncbi:MAG TPA: peptide deformylase [Candidatus Pelethomonas intestinigallinarum]|nr:peptide deformylase [Candidatus Pelethomonas intestinigallinarum]
MATRKIVIQGDELLTKKCRPVTEFNPRLHQLLDDMADTLEEAQGAGLAAPQVGILRRAVLVIDDDDKVMELINPEILLQEGEQTGPEGCLSVPGKFGMVTRPNHVRVRAQDRYGNWFEAEGEGLVARCFCHEIEHLDGHLYTEHIDRFLTDEELEAYYREQGYEMPDGEDEAE